MNRVILFHFHLFKNAGTSIDAILKKNFRDKFVNKEFDFYPYKRNINAVISWIRKEKDKIAFSSHTARLFDFTQLEKEGIKLIPIIFVRHPLVRIHSAYKFEREKQRNIESFEPVLARNTTFKGYIEVRWYLPNDHQTRNFHISRFSDMFYEEEGDMFSKALKALEHLTFVGLVEKFEESIKKLENIVKEYYPDFKVENIEENIQISPIVSIEERLKEIRKILGKFYFKFEEANKMDILFWEKVVEKYSNEELNHEI